MLQGPPTTGARMYSSRAGEPASQDVDVGNALNHNQKETGVLLYSLIPHPARLQHLHPVQSVVGLEDDPEVLEAEGGCLHVRENGRQGEKEEQSRPLFQAWEQQVQKRRGCSRRGWTITAGIAVVSPHWPLQILHQLPATSRTPVSTPPLILPTPPHLPPRSDIQPSFLGSPPLPSHPTFHLPPTLLSLPLLRPSLTTQPPPGPSPPPAPHRHGSHPTVALH